MPIEYLDEAPKEPGALEKAGATLYGGVTGFAGGLGELEKFGAYEVPEMLGLREKGQRDKLMGRQTIFPTVEEAQKVLAKAGIQKPREEVSGYQTAGEVIGGLGTALPKLLRSGTRALVGTTTPALERVAKTAEDMGFKLSPSQTRQVAPTGQRGASGFGEHNQALANELASAGTGVKSSEVTSGFIGDRLKDLGQQFNNLYKGKTFNIDQDAVNALRQIRAMEMQLPGAAGVSPVAQTANEILKNFSRLAGRPGAKPNTFGIEGEALQRIRNALTERARGTSAGNAREIYNLIDVIDASIAKNHPAIAAKLSEIRPQYRNTIILEDLYKNGGISQGNISLERLGTMLRGQRDVVRRTGQDIDQLGEIGRELRLRAQWEPAGTAASEGAQTLANVLGQGKSALATMTGLQTRPARIAQKYYSKVPPPYVAGAERAAAVPALGTVTRPLQQEGQ